MPQREHKRVRVVSGDFCIHINCRNCLVHLFDTGSGAEVDCRQAACDNHLQDEEDELPPAPSRPPAWFKDALELA